jgi:outer membrane lipoprotein-sorting protein
MTRFLLAPLILLVVTLVATTEETTALRSLQMHLTEASTAFEKVTDYTCTVIKQERIGGRLLPEQTASMSVMEKPFSVLLKFTAPKDLHGQEVCYVSGKHNNQMRVKGSGLKGAIGFVSLNVNDSRVMAQSRHTITEAGLGNLIQTTGKSIADESKEHLTVELTSVEFKERKCQRYEVRFSEKSKSPFAKSVIYFDDETKLPIKFDAYDFPRDGETLGELLESYTFLNLKLNVGLTVEQFRK